MIKTVNIKELKANHPDVYQKEHERYCQSQWELPLEEDFYVDSLNEDNDWLDVDAIRYSISYSQGDDAFFTGKVWLENFLEAFDTENEYFVLREALKIGDCDEYMVISEGVGYRSSARFDEIIWRGYDDGALDEDAVLECDGPHKSILAGMNYWEYYQICIDQINDLETWVKGKCEAMFGKLYDQLRDEIDYQMSEEAFNEWAESLDEQFEVEVDDEPEGHDSGRQGERLAA